MVGVLTSGSAQAKNLSSLTDQDQIVSTAFAELNHGQLARLHSQLGQGELAKDFSRNLATPDELEPAQVSLTDIRLVLAQLSFAGGANNHLTVVNAQSEGSKSALTVQGGSITLRELKAIVNDRFDQEKILVNGNFSVPIAIWPDAQLVLSSGDVLNLSRPSGAFLANFGRLIINGASVTATNAENVSEPEFRPFVATVGSGFAKVQNSRFENLGFGANTAFSGISILSGGLYPALDRSLVINSTFTNSGTLTLKGTKQAIIAGNTFTAAIGGALELRQAKDTQVHKNTFVSTEHGSAMRIVDGTVNTSIRGNVILNSGGHGIEIDGAGNETNISGNLIWRNSQAGISIRRADCVSMKDNLVFRNKNKGIFVRTSRASTIVDNEIFANKSAGLFISQQPVGTLTILTGNNLVGNRVGLKSASSAVLELKQNNFSDQFPRLLDGDLTNQSHAIFQDLAGMHKTRLSSGGLDFFGLGQLSCARSELKDG